MDETQRFLRNGKCFEVTIDNFNEAINRRGAIERTLGEICGHLWFAKIRKNLREGVDFLSINFIALITSLSWLEEFYTEMAICVKNERLERWEKRQGRFEVKPYYHIGWWKLMTMDTILDPDSGFLRDDGSLRIQIEIRVDYFDRDGDKLFNFFDPFEGSMKIKTDSMNFYGCKQNLMFHSPVLTELLADGGDEIVLPNFVSKYSVENFIQLIHGVKMDVSKDNILHVLYLAHKYQVLTVLRHLQNYIKSYSEQEIHEIYVRTDAGWIMTLLCKEYHIDLLRMKDTFNKPLSKKYKKQNIRKRKMLLAITRAPFSPNLHSDPIYIDQYPFSISRFFSRSIKRTTGR